MARQADFHGEHSAHTAAGRFALMTVFFAYPYALDKERGYRDKLVHGFRDEGILLSFADEFLSNKHVMEKIRAMMERADLIVFDLTGANPNVTLELGIAIADDHPYVVVIRNDTVGTLNSDIHGWDQLRYESEEDLIATLVSRIRQQRVPRRSIAASDQSMPQFEAINFGLPERSTEDRHVVNLGIVARPIVREPIHIADLLGNPREVNRRVAAIVSLVAAEQRAKSYFDGTGFTPREYEHYVEIFEAPGNNEGLRVYRDGNVVYYRSVRAEPTVSLAPSTFEELCRATLHVARQLYLAFDLAVPSVETMATFVPTAPLRIDQARPNFRPMGYHGDELFPETPHMLHVPSLPLRVSLDVDAILKAASEMKRVLRTHASPYRF